MISAATFPLTAVDADHDRIRRALVRLVNKLAADGIATAVQGWSVRERRELRALAELCDQYDLPLTAAGVRQWMTP
jgi:hypothetical protein